MHTLAYLPILFFLVVALALPFVLLCLARLVRPHRPNPVKLANYECGIESPREVRGRYSVHFYIIAVLFVVFDVETIFLFPWAVRFRVLGVFLLILVVAYVYAWRKGALQWV